MGNDICEAVAERLRAAEDPGEVWLSCWSCRHFFQYRRVRRSGRAWSCPFCFEDSLLIQTWDAEREPDDPRWPASTSELRHGMSLPDMEDFNRRQAERKRARLIGQLHDSPEWRRLHRDDWPRWTEHLLHTFWTWGVDPGDILPELLSEGLADIFALWSDAVPTDANTIAAELRAYFDFATRRLGHAHARSCLHIVSEPHVPRLLAAAIQDMIRRRQRASRDIRTVRCASPPSAP